MSSALTQEIMLKVDKLVRRNCIKFKFMGMEDDLKQEIYVKLLTKSDRVGTSYIERFDPALNSLEGYLSRFIYNFFCRVHARSRYVVERAKPISEVFDLGEPPVAFSDMNTAMNAEKVYLILDERFPYTSGVVCFTPLEIPVKFSKVVQKGDIVSLEEGQVIVWRSVANIFCFMLSGMTQEEVASIMDVSKGWISKQVNKIREQVEIHEWAKEFGMDVESLQNSF